MCFLSVFTIYLNLSTAGSSAGPLQNASLSYDSYQVFSVFSSFMECCIQTSMSSTRCLIMEGFATEDGAASRISMCQREHGFYHVLIQNKDVFF